ncbi:hypothetical protein [Streptomyces sp. A3M-1-3]|nr:hypothetical protein [Streptomyces sp. A3M-1-3]
MTPTTIRTLHWTLEPDREPDAEPVIHRPWRAWYANPGRGCI